MSISREIRFSRISCNLALAQTMPVSTELFSFALTQSSFVYQSLLELLFSKKHKKKHRHIHRQSHD